MEINGNISVRGLQSNTGLEGDPNLGRVKTVKVEEKAKYVQQSDNISNEHTKKKLSEEDVIDVIQKANKDFVAYDRRFEFSIHEKTKQIMVKVIDATNDEVIRELPPEKVLDMVAALWEVAGIIVDKKI